VNQEVAVTIMGKFDDRWNDKAEKSFVGRKIIEARYMSPEEADQMGWHSRSIVFTLDDGTQFFPSMDDEGNNAGSLFANSKDGKSLDMPVL